jgi:hypothetical protein
MVGKPFGQGGEEAHCGKVEGVFEHCHNYSMGVGLCRREEEAEAGLLYQSAGYSSAG